MFLVLNYIHTLREYSPSARVVPKATPVYIARVAKAQNQKPKKPETQMPVVAVVLQYTHYETSYL
jgi:hypothetical protein